MAITPKKVDFSTINEVVNGGGISPEQINAPLQASAYAQELATNQPDVSEANGSGDASVEIIETNGKPQFKFKNIKGANIIVAKNSETAPEELPSIATGRQINSQVGAPNVGYPCIIQYTNPNSKGQISVYGIIDTIVVSNIVSIVPIGWFNGASGGGSGTITAEDLPNMNYFEFGYGENAEETVIQENGIRATYTSTEIEYQDKDGNYGYQEPSVTIKVPIVAGENVTFEKDETNQTVKINASGGGTYKYFEPYNGTGYNASYTVDTNLVTFTLPKTYTQFENKAEYFSVGLRFNLYDDTNARIGTVVTPYFDTRIDSVEPTYAVDNFVVRSMATLNGTEDQQKTFRIQCFVVSDDDEQTVVAFKLFSPTYTTLVDPSAMYNPSFALTQTKAWYKE